MSASQYPGRPLSWPYEPPTQGEAATLCEMRDLLDEGRDETVDQLAKAFLNQSHDRRTARRRAHALLALAGARHEHT
jgi:hypothetical protein